MQIDDSTNVLETREMQIAITLKALGYNPKYESRDGILYFQFPLDEVAIFAYQIKSKIPILIESTKFWEAWTWFRELLRQLQSGLL